MNERINQRTGLFIAMVLLFGSCAGKSGQGPATVAMKPECGASALAQQCCEDVLVCALEVVSLSETESWQASWYSYIAHVYQHDGRCDRAVEVLDKITDTEQRSKYSTQVLRHMSTPCSLLEVESIANRIMDGDSRLMAVSMVANNMAAGGEIGAALDILSLVSSDEKYDSRIVWASWHAAQNQHCDGAFSMLETVSEGVPDFTLFERVKIFATCGEIVEARERAQSIEELEYRVKAMVFVAQTMGNTGNKVGAQEIMAEVAEMLKGTETPWNHPNTIGLGWVSAGNVEKAQQGCALHENVHSRDGCFTELVTHLASEGDYGSAMTTASKIDDKAQADNARLNVAEKAFEAQEAQQVVGMAKQVEDPSKKMDFLLLVAREYLNTGKYNQAFTLCDQIEEGEIKSTMYFHLAKRLATEHVNAGNFKDALALCDQVEMHENKRAMYYHLAMLLARKGEHNMAVETYKQYQTMLPAKSDPSYPFDQLLIIDSDGPTSPIEDIKLERMVENGQAEDAIASVESPDYQYDRGRALKMIAEALVEQDMMEEALECALKIEDQDARYESLGLIAFAMAHQGSIAWGLLAALSAGGDWNQERFGGYFTGMMSWILPSDWEFKKLPRPELPLNLSSPELGGRIACLIDEGECW